MTFEWDPEKNKANEEKHGVSFNEAKEVFYDPNAVFIPDDEHSWAEERLKIIGA